MKGVCLDLESATAAVSHFFHDFSRSKEDGRFRMDDHPAGEYRVVANRNGSILAASPFPAVYYPGTEDPKQAAILVISAGTRLENPEMRIPRLAKTFTISGRILFSDGKPAPRSLVRIPAGEEESTHARIDEPALTNCPGYREAAGNRRNYVTFQTPEVATAAEADETGIVLTLPVRWCAIR